jgi:hypothetical protein
MLCDSVKAGGQRETVECCVRFVDQEWGWIMGEGVKVVRAAREGGMDVV